MYGGVGYGEDGYVRSLCDDEGVSQWAFSTSNRRRNFDVETFLRFSTLFRRRIDVDISTVFIRRRKSVENRRLKFRLARWIGLYRVSPKLRCIKLVIF